MIAGAPSAAFLRGEAPTLARPSARHRLDIDGLRAVAVLPVLLFHGRFSTFAGGLLGVDVFFVISGFLITGILLGEAEQGRFSIVAFYNRRVRRIFPALFTLLAATTVIACALLASSALERYGESLIATTLFSSNFLFFTEAGYFDTASHEKPLLHTWSLAVEEQFYLLWPLILGTFFRFRAERYLYAFLVTGVIGSFALAAAGPIWSVAGTFFLPFTRAWELGLGALLAVRPPRVENWKLREVGAAAGLAAIIVAITAFDESTPLAIASGTACIGTALLIACNSKQTYAARLLSTRTMVGIGLISYSLYLWHWPLLAFSNYYFAGPPSAPVRAGVLMLATVLATLSYLLVEKPLRRPGPPKRAFLLSAFVMVGLLAAGIAIVASKGFPQRFSPRIARVEEALQRSRQCWGCRIGAPGPAHVAIWGDSHGMAISPAIDDILAASGTSGIAFLGKACPPVVGAQPQRSDETDPAECRKRQGQAIARISKLRDVRLIIVIGRWSMASETTRFAQERGTRYFLRDAQSGPQTIADSRRALQAALRRTVDELLARQPNARILFLGQAPEVGYEASECMLRGMIYGRRTPQCERTVQGAAERLQFSNAVLSSLAMERPRVSALLLGRMLCRSGSCPTRIGQTLLYRDDDHLTSEGAKLLLSPCLSELLARLKQPQGSARPQRACSGDVYVD